MNQVLLKLGLQRGNEVSKLINVLYVPILRCTSQNCSVTKYIRLKSGEEKAQGEPVDTNGLGMWGILVEV